MGVEDHGDAFGVGSAGSAFGTGAAPRDPGRGGNGGGVIGRDAAGTGVGAAGVAGMADDAASASCACATGKSAADSEAPRTPAPASASAISFPLAEAAGPSESIGAGSDVTFTDASPATSVSPTTTDDESAADSAASRNRTPQLVQNDASSLMSCPQLPHRIWRSLLPQGSFSSARRPSSAARAPAPIPQQHTRGMHTHAQGKARRIGPGLERGKEEERFQL